MDTFRQDLRFAARQLLRKPGFAAVAALTLALGIGANTAIFSVVDAVLLRPLPYGDAERIVAVWNRLSHRDQVHVSVRELLDYREAIGSLEAVAGYQPGHLSLTGDDRPERVAAGSVTANVFEVLGAVPAVGRTFTAAEERPGGEPVVVLGHELWRGRFAADPAVVGRTLQINGTARTVVGVMPRGFRLPQDFASGEHAQLFVPLALDPENPGNRGSRTLFVLGRIRPGATLAAVNAELDLLTRRWHQDGIATDVGFSAFVRPIRDEVSGAARPMLRVLGGAVGLLLLIACVNVAGLLLGRADERRKELAVRTALGAARGRIARQLAVESLLLAAVGAGAGLVLAALVLRALVALEPSGVPRLEEVAINGTVLGFTAAAALVSALLFGLVPAVQAARPELSTTLREGGRGSGAAGGRQRFRRVLVVAEISLAIVLVTGAGLMIRSFGALLASPLGYDPENVLTVRLALPSAAYPEPEQMISFYRSLVDRAEALPGVRSAGATALLPLAHPAGDWSVDLEDRSREGGINHYGYFQIVTPGYFETLGIDVVRGRGIHATDHMDALPVLAVSERFAAVHWPDADPLGRRVRIRTGAEEDGPWFTVVGVVRDVRHNAVGEVPRQDMYFPHAQLPLALGGTVGAMTLTLRADADALTLAGPVRDVVRSLDPALPVAEVRTMERVVGEAVSDPRFSMLLLAAFAGLALLLGAVGIYGVVAHSVTRRAHEIGVRMALGARIADVLRLVLRQGLVLAAAGVAVGLVGALVATRVLESHLYGVSRTDPLTFAAVPVILTAVALIAAYLPARRAARVDPMVALRAE